MANPNALLLLLLLLLIVGSAHTTVAETLLRDRRACIAEVEKMEKWPCIRWLMSAYSEGDAGKRLQPCCDELNSLSSNCRCQAIWEMRKVERKYGDLPCNLPEQCGFNLCGNCPAAGRLSLAA